MEWTKLVRCLSVAMAVVLCAIPAVAQVDWDAGGGSDHRWFLDTNWSGNTLPALGDVTREINGTATGALERVVYQERPDQNALFVDPGIGSFRASAPSGSTYTFRFERFGSANNLTTSGNNGNADFWHDGLGKYVIEIDHSSELRVGNPQGQFQLPPVEANLYGFALELKGLPAEVGSDAAVVRVTGTLGQGFVDVVDHVGTIIVGVPGDSSLPGTIDCAFNGSGDPVDPVAQSRWLVDDTPATGNASLSVQSGTIKNVGFWNFMGSAGSTGSTTVITNVFETYAPGGELRLQLSNFFINDADAPASPAQAPRATFAGSSVLTHSLPGFGRFDFAANSGTTPVSLELLGDACVIRPSEYPTVPLDPVPMYLKFNSGSGHVDIRSKVATEALPFDVALTDLDLTTSLDLECFTPDECNIVLMDHLVPDDGNPVTCLPSYNRCTKHWHNMRMRLQHPQRVSFRNDVLPYNHIADYPPSGYPPEAAYFCKISSDFLDNTVFQLNGNRVYARDVDLPSGVTLPITKVGLTRYMDADLDFDVDMLDFARFQNAYTGSGGVTWYPLADFGATASSPAGDCDVDLEDFGVFFERWQTDGPDPQVFRVCTAANVPDGVHGQPNNANLANGDPSTVVCGGPLHVRPTQVPPLDCPNCQLYTLGCADSLTGGPQCTRPCPWLDGAPLNPNGRFDIAVVEDTSCALCTSVSHGDTVNYRIVGRLTDTVNDGLGLWSADLSMSGPAAVALSPTAIPTTAPMAYFVCSRGINNPPCETGYGGTVSGNNLVQIGGAQNTIRNGTGGNPQVAPFPIGGVVGDVAQTWTTLAAGSVTMPSTAGVYVLRLSDVFANMIVEDQLDNANAEYFRTERADVRSVQNLRIRVDLDPVVSIDSADPPTFDPYVINPYFRDVLQTRPAGGTTTTLTQGIGGSGTPSEGPYSYAPILVTFSASTSLAASDVSLSCSYTGSPPGTTPCPGVNSVSGSGVGPYSITLNAPIPPGGCTTIFFANSCETLRYESLPGDVNLNGTSTGQDVIELVNAINMGQTGSSNYARYDINRNSSITGQDVIRLVQLLNGTNTTQAWNGVALVGCPPPVDCEESGGGGNAPTGAGGESESGGAGERPLTSEQIALITAAIQAGCAELDLDSTACQQLLDSLFPPSQP